MFDQYAKRVMPDSIHAIILFGRIIPQNIDCLGIDDEESWVCTYRQTIILISVYSSETCI